jgi:hypothetical protein
MFCRKETAPSNLDGSDQSGITLFSDLQLAYGKSNPSALFNFS